MAGCPNSHVEEEITARLPVAEESPLLMQGFNLRIRLSKLAAKTRTSEYWDPMLELR